MKYLAIDIAIIPPADVLNGIISLNKGMINKSSDFFLLGKKDYLPHITLVMGVIKEDDLEKIIKIIKDVSLKHHPLKLFVQKIKSNQKADSTWNSHIEIKKTKSLLKFHEEIVDAISPFLIKKSSPEMFYSSPKPVKGAGALLWVKKYVEISAYSKYWPHISMSKGRIPDKQISKVKLQKTFVASRLIIAHLGVHCTCRKILYETKLK